MEASVRTDMDALPESCVSAILSFTSPAEACRLSLVSSTFLSAAESDVVWTRFLPPDHVGTVSGSAAPVKFSSKKELYLRLCDRPLLIDGGRRSFKLDRSSGTVSYILSARELSIKRSDDPTHWIWKTTLPESRFKEVAELRTIDRIEIEGSIETKALSPHTLYGAHLIFKVSDRAFGLDLMPSETSVEMGNRVRPGTARLQPPDRRKRRLESLLYANRSEMLAKHRETEDDRRGGGAPPPVERGDGWMEVELGEFLIGGGGGGEGGVVKMSLKQVKGYQLKGGLVVEGIEVRPKSPVHSVEMGLVESAWPMRMMTQIL